MIIYVKLYKKIIINDDDELLTIVHNSFYPEEAFIVNPNKNDDSIIELNTDKNLKPNSKIFLVSVYYDIIDEEKDNILNYGLVSYIDVFQTREEAQSWVYTNYNKISREFNSKAFHDVDCIAVESVFLEG